MNIYKKIYFHYRDKNSCHSDLWHKGNTLTFDKSKYNYFYGLYDEFFPVIELQGKDVPIISAINEILEKKLFNHYDLDESEYLIKKMEFAINKFGLFWRESIFEEVRLYEYPNLPSRKHGLWVCNESSLEHWKGNGDKLFKLELTGNAHVGSDEYLKNEIMPAIIMRKQAKKYWDGCDEKSPSCEILFEGEFKILEELKDFYDI